MPDDPSHASTHGFAKAPRDRMKPSVIATPQRCAERLLHISRDGAMDRHLPLPAGAMEVRAMNDYTDYLRALRDRRPRARLPTPATAAPHHRRLKGKSD